MTFVTRSSINLAILLIPKAYANFQNTSPQRSLGYLLVGQIMSNRDSKSSQIDYQCVETLLNRKPKSKI
tara:strand:+ start:117 stop:323 length:207 start_codon:yes stop_codon:yes gene_type:complete